MDERHSSRPDFVVIGAGKCGTTTLCAHLARHPDVFVCSPKEPNFFAFDDVYANGWSWYEGLFRAGQGAKVRGEGSVACTSPEFEQRAVQRMREHLPDLRLFYIVRNPLERVVSAYRELHSNGHMRGRHLPYALGAAIDTAFDELVGESLYGQRLALYRAHYPDEQICVLFLEDYAADSQAELRRCFEFLRLDPDAPLAPAEARLNEAADKVRDTPLMRLLRRRPELVRLGKALPGARTLARSLLRKPFAGAVEWDEQARDLAVDVLREDAARFLDAHGKPRDFWQLAPT